MDDVPFYGSAEGDGGTAAEVAEDLAGWLKLIKLEEYLDCFVSEGYEDIGDVMVLARAGTEAIEELITICNQKVAGGKLSKHRFKHAFKIDVADYYDTHKNPDAPESRLDYRASTASVDDGDLAFLLCNDPDVQQQLSVRRSSRRGVKKTKKKPAGSPSKTPDVDRVVEDDDDDEMTQTIQRVPSKSFKRLSQLGPAEAAAMTASRGSNPIASATTPATVPGPAKVTPVPVPVRAKVSGSPKGSPKAGAIAKGAPRATGGTSWVQSHSKGKGKVGAKTKKPAGKEMSFAEMKASLLASKSSLDSKVVGTAAPKGSVTQSGTVNR